MKKMSLIIIMLSVLMIGCSVTIEQREIVEDPSPSVRRFVSLHQVQRGLTSEEVKAVLGEQVIVGYEMPDSRTKQYKPVLVNNPQRVENFVQGSRTFVVEYYLVGINQSDGVTADNELSPLVYEGGKLIGWGWAFLNKAKK